MVKKVDRNTIVGLDIGTSKIVAIVGEIKDDNNSKLLAWVHILRMV